MTQTYKKLLNQFISFKSISTDAQFKDEVAKTAEFLNAQFSAHGFNTEVIAGYGNPIVLAKYTVDPGAETCLIYGHYDVQPAEESDGWESDPFTVRETEDRIYARGIVDNKGQVLIHIATILDAIVAGDLKYNIVFMLEGDEETGSPLMENFVKEHVEKLNCDFFVISDGEILGDLPIIESGFRGGANTTLTLTTADTDVHSGIYGGGIPSASHEAAKFVLALFDAQQRVQIPGFYDDVDPIDPAIRKNNESLPFSTRELEEMIGVKETIVEDGFDFYSATSLRPTVQITGLSSGYVGSGYRNGIPAKAVIKANFRLVKSQDPHKIMQQYEQFIQDTLPAYVSYDLDISDPYEGCKLDTANNYVRLAQQSLEKAFGKKARFKFSGGGLPIVTLFAAALPNADAVLVPLGNEDCNMHGINENYDKRILEKALAFSHEFFRR